MARPPKDIGVLIKKKRDLSQKQRETLVVVRKFLASIGYRIEPAFTSADGAGPATKRRGRRSMSAAERKAVSRRMKAYWARRRKTARTSVKR